MYNRQEEEKKQNERFRAQIKEVERKIIEANQCAQFMHKNIKFSYQLVSVMPDTFRLDSTPGEFSSSAPRQEIQIKVHNGDTNSIIEWSLKTFQDKLEEIKDMMNQYQEGGTLAKDDPHDPFKMTQEPIQLGQAYYRLEGLAYLMDNPATISIVGTNS